MTTEKPIEIKSWPQSLSAVLHPFKPEVWMELDKLGCFVETRHNTNGFAYIIHYPDTKYGASVIKKRGSHGADKDLFELSVTWEGHLCYDTQITDGVIENLTDGDVMTLLRLIARLDEKGRIRK